MDFETSVFDLIKVGLELTSVMLVFLGLLLVQSCMECECLVLYFGSRSTGGVPPMYQSSCSSREETEVWLHSILRSLHSDLQCVSIRCIITITSVLDWSLVVT